MDPPATPGPSRSAKDPTLAPVPSTPDGRRHRLHQSSPRHSNSPFPARTPRTPEGTTLKPCTMDESLYARVTVHTAKCTECDKRNMDTMRRCPGCTFQICQPCYDKRERQSKGLVHGNMSTPSTTGSASATSGGRTVRKKPVASTPSGESSEKKASELNKEQDEDSFATGKKCGQPTLEPTSKKGATKRLRVEDSEPEKLEPSKDEFDPYDTSPTPSKRHCRNLSFAESALATALRNPPATWARRRSFNTAPTQSAVPSGSRDILSPQFSVGFTRNEHVRGNILYQNAVQGYDEPLLSRCEPVVSNPVAEIPATIKRSGEPRPSAEEIHANIQKKLLEKMQQRNELGVVQERAIAGLVADKVGLQPDHTSCQTESIEEAEDLCTVRAFVEKEATKHLDHVVMDEDENKALFNHLESAALVWGKQTYNKLNPVTQETLQSGLKLRLDRIDGMYTTELKKLLDEHAARMLQELSGEDHFYSMPPPIPSAPQFKPA